MHECKFHQICDKHILVCNRLLYATAISLVFLQTASSGRMAELLGGDGGGFIGFETVSGGVGGMEGEEVAHGAGAEFQVVMKQLGKRDTTTKLKVCCVTVFTGGGRTDNHIKCSVKKPY